MLVGPTRTAAAVTADAAVPMLNRVFGVTGVRVSTSRQPNSSGQTIVPPAPTATENAWQVLLQDGGAHELPRALDRGRVLG